MRLIFRTRKFVWDCEWVLTKHLPETGDDDEDQDSDLQSSTERAPDEPFSEDSAVPKAKRIKGFVPNEKEEINE